MSSTASFSAIVVSHANETGLRKMLGNLMYQTRKPDEIVVLVSGLGASRLGKLREQYPEITFHARDDRQDWGHEKRAEGVLIASKDYLGFFNDDDSYTLDYIEKMMRAVDGYDVAYCDWNKIPGCDFALRSSTSGNYIVRTGLAREVGYNWRDYMADGRFIEDLNEAGAAVAPKVEEILYFHNHQP